jgi:hypothetical protein
MAAITPTAGQSGQRSATFTLPTSAGTDTVSNAALVGVLSPGPLKTLLSATYANVAAFAAAAAKAGLNVTVSGGTSPSAFDWVVSNSTPSLSMTAAAASTVVVRMSVAHSITQ